MVQIKRNVELVAGMRSQLISFFRKYDNYFDMEEVKLLAKQSNWFEEVQEISTKRPFDKGFDDHEFYKGIYTIGFEIEDIDLSQFYPGLSEKEIEEELKYYLNDIGNFEIRDGLVYDIRNDAYVIIDDDGLSIRLEEILLSRNK